MAVGGVEVRGERPQRGGPETDQGAPVRSRRKVQNVLFALALVAAAAACTSVERAESVSATGSVAAGGAGGQGATRSGVPGTVAPGTTGSGSVAAGGGGAAPTGGGSGGAPADGGGAGGAEAAGPDFSGCPLGGPLRVGVSYSSDLAAGLAAVGQPEAAASAGQYGEQMQAAYGAIVEDLNARGGIAGCQVELAYFDFSSLASDGFDGQSQKECAFFAEDAKVFAAYSSALETETLVECLADRGVVSLFNGAEYAPIQRDFDRYRGFLYQPWGLNTDRWGRLIDIWDQVGFFGDDAKVGILVADDGTGNGQKLAYEIWQPKLEALGIDVSVFEYKWIRSYSSVSDASTAMSAAVLKFKSEGVTHVLPTPDGAAMGIFMTAIAESQDYRPAYGTTSFSGGSPITASDSQTRNWVAIAWDVTTFRTSTSEPAAAEGQYAPNPRRAHCDEVIARVQAGAHVFHKFCDAVDFLAASLEGSAEVSPAALLAGAEALGASMPLASGQGPNRWGPDRYDSAGSVIVGKWNVSAGEYDLISPVLEVP